jgi:hypothetical protein
MKLFAAAALTLTLTTPLFAGHAKAAPVPMPTDGKAAEASGKTSDGAKARAVELNVSQFDVAGKSQSFLSSKELVKVGPARLVDPARDLAGGLVAVDVQAGTKDGDPVWVRLAVPGGDVKRVGSILRSDDYSKLLLLIGNRVDQSCSTHECCATDDAGACTRMCCGK